MSDSIFDDELENEGLEPASDELGMTSDEAPTDEAPTDEGAEEGVVSQAEDEQADSKQPNFSVYDALLLVSLLCITAATLLLVFELRKFGNFPFSFPWRTSEFLNVLGF